MDSNNISMMENDPKEYYKILELKPGSSIQEVKSQYKKLIKKFKTT